MITPSARVPQGENSSLVMVCPPHATAVGPGGLHSTTNLNTLGTDEMFGPSVELGPSAADTLDSIDSDDEYSIHDLDGATRPQSTLPAASQSART